MLNRKIREKHVMNSFLESNSYQVMSTNQSLNGVYVQASMLNHTCFKGNTGLLFSEIPLCLDSY